MQLTLELDIKPLAKPIVYTDKLLLIGSCFTENMHDRLVQHKFQTLSNPHGILFNPLSVAESLNSYIDGKQYVDVDLFHLNELWNSWEHHTRFSHTDKMAALAGINQSQHQATTFVKDADVVIITLGSAFQYYLKDGGKHVANNHRAPSQWFEKQLLNIDIIVGALSETLNKLFTHNPKVQVIFTISPVRHIRDGVVDNNRSKARLLEAVHTLCDIYDKTYYFPAYELVIDILRDYRFYDIDFVHPNYLATSVVWEHFIKACMGDATRQLMKQVHEVVVARNHKPRFPDTDAHTKFRNSYQQKLEELMQKHPYLNLNEELNYFQSR
jgi:hypothetical protein